jgi:RNA polymerase sigma-70 factor, ECF subfamily
LTCRASAAGAQRESSGIRKKIVFPFERFARLRLHKPSTMDSASMPDLVSEEIAEPTAIVADLRRGDPTALAVAYRQHHTAVRAFAQRLVGDIEAAEDLVQEVFVALPSAITRFREASSLRTFLVSIAVNHAKNHVRAAARRRAALAKLALEPAPSSVDPERDVARTQLANRMMLALDALPVDQRVVVVLAEIEERTSPEIAAIVGAPEGTVRTRLFHAKKKLRELLGGAP